MNQIRQRDRVPMHGLDACFLRGPEVAGCSELYYQFRWWPSKPGLQHERAYHNGIDYVFSSRPVER